MILYVLNGIVIWFNDDINLKELEPYKSDNCCIVVDKSVEIPDIPDDGHQYTMLYNAYKNQILLERGKKIEISNEDLTKDIHQSSVQIQDDTLLGIELNTDTNSKVTTTGDDSILLMELMMSIDEKLTQLLQSK